jgi:glycerol dehydrogenase
MLSVFCSPSRYTQGRNATASLGQEIVNLGLEGPALIVAGKSAIALLSGVWESSLYTAGLMHSILRFGGECSLLEIEKGKAAARQSDARIIIGAGGGKVLDTARAVASDLNLPVVNCPTVASSDAPCSALSVVYTDEGVFQEYRIYRRNPDLVLVDTEVIARSPARLLVAGMGDALATWFEAKVCADGNVRNMRGGASTRALWRWPNSVTGHCWRMASPGCTLCKLRWSRRRSIAWWRRTRCFPDSASNPPDWPQHTRFITA